MSYACTLCNHECVVVRVSYRVKNLLMVGVPTRLCTNPKCVKNVGGEVYEHRELTKPPSETTIKGPSPTHETTPEEYKNLQLIYDDWVVHGKPGYFSEWIGKIEDVARGD